MGPLKNAPLALTFFSARATTTSAAILAAVSATTPLVSASASRATSAPSARARPSSPKCSPCHITSRLISLTKPNQIVGDGKQNQIHSVYQYLCFCCYVVPLLYYVGAGRRIHGY